MGVPHPAPRQQRGALLPARRRARARDAADRLHPHRRHGDPGVQPPVPPAPRCLPQHRGRRGHRRVPGRHRSRSGRHRPHRRLRRRGDPRHRRLGRRRDRHLDRQARGLHRRGRHRPRPGAGGRVWTWAPTASSCSTTLATSACVAPGSAARRTTPSSTPTWPRRRRGSPRRSCTGRTSPARRRAGSSRATATPCAPSTTTSRARLQSGWPACWPGSASRADGWSTSRSSSSAPARPGSGSRT